MTKKKAPLSMPGRVHDPRQYSRLVVDGAKQSPSRAMLRAVGFGDADFHKPQI
jgi:dihydroxy-acid dehydratase